MPSGKNSKKPKGLYAVSSLVWALVAVFWLQTTPALAVGKRVALLIGNATYAKPELVLANPGNDARALSRKLSELGFQVSTAIDADQAGMETALQKFEADMADAEMAVFFYAGHGVQIAGENILIASNFQEASEAELERAGVRLQRVRKAFAAARPKLGIMILDACRDNPFSDTGMGPPGLARASGGAGLLIAYATDPGNVAYDGIGENSTFTSALLRNIDTPGLDIRLMFGRVRQDVILATNGIQIPWVEESVLGEHSFNTDPSTRVFDPDIARDVERWRDVSRIATREAFDAYLSEFPNGLFREFAAVRVTDHNGTVPSDAATLTDAIESPARLNIIASLSVLGFLPDDKAATFDDAVIKRALMSYLTQIDKTEKVDTDRLFLDAARTLVLLGANTAQQLRTDLVAIRSIDKALVIAQDAFEELTLLGTTDDSVAPVLAQAEADLMAIEARREDVLAQLDVSRSYYAGLLRHGSSHLARHMSRALAGNTSSERGGSGIENRLQSDARRFVRHVQGNRNSEREGSYGWLVDFLP